MRRVPTGNENVFPLDWTKKLRVHPTDFGSLMQPTNDVGSCTSPTRGFIFADGATSKLIQFFTIQTLGDATKFGDLTGNNVRYPAGLSNNKLPVGLQIIGPHFSENRLLRLAKNVEELFPIGFPTID